MYAPSGLMHRMTMIMSVAAKSQNFVDALISESLRFDQGPQQIAEQEERQ
jgi:hypothetical protein